MRVMILAVGSLRGPGMAAAAAAYESRLRAYFKLEVREVRPATLTGSPDTVREEEAGAIEAAMPEDLDVMALTREGKGMTSRGLAGYLQKLGVYSRPGVVFVIGGAEGLAARVLRTATYRLSLSPMTLTHELARVLLLEQLYRAGTIMRGEPYHRGS